VSDDPFRALGLPPSPELSDDDVRAAWRRVAAATHPDRDDGGDPARFGAAAAAYVVLRTAYGRGEALADLGFPVGHARPAKRRRRIRTGAGIGGGPRRLALRAAAAAAVCASAFLAAGWSPASIGLLAGALTWLVVSGRHDFTHR
jgi:curved DNA-binding protein CbpA